MDMQTFVERVLNKLAEKFRKDQPNNPVWPKVVYTNFDATVIEARIDFGVGKPLELLFLKEPGNYCLVYMYKYGGWIEVGEYSLEDEEEVERAFEEIYY